MGSCFVAQGQPGAVWQPGGVGWGGTWEGIQEGGAMCLHIAISCWCMAETNTTL